METENKIAFPEIFKAVLNRHCTVLGSAPGRILPVNYSNSFLVCVNGSQLGLTRSPDLTVMGAQICRGNTRTCRNTIRNISGRYSERMLWVHPGSLTDFEDRYRDYGFRWQTSEVLTAELRLQLVKSLIGYELPGLSGQAAPSNGALAALLTATGGATRVDLAGFSFQPGHFYISGDTVRNHVIHDSILFKWLAKNSAIYSKDLEMRQNFGFREPPQLASKKRWFLFS